MAIRFDPVHNDWRVYISRAGKRRLVGFAPTREAAQELLHNAYLQKEQEKKKSEIEKTKVPGM